MFNFAVSLREGQGTPRNLTASTVWMAAAAEAGVKEAAYTLAVLGTLQSHVFESLCCQIQCREQNLAANIKLFGRSCCQGRFSGALCGCIVS